MRQQYRIEQPDLERTPPERVRAALAAAWRYYTLPRLAEKAAAYLADRGIDVGELGDVAGHTPYNPDQLVAHLRKRGFTDDELVDAGLARRRDHEPVTDAFQHRIVLAVKDDQGAVVGLLGRSTLGDERRMAAKYLNPPRTVVYDKSTALYTPERVQLAEDGQVVIVEGALDALAIAAAAQAAGLGDRFQPVCTSGLAFSASQIEQILAMHPRAPVIALDGDQAGQRAAALLAARIAQHGREAAIVTWPSGEDPASWLAKHGPNALTAVTRRGCLDADRTELRPHHAAPEAAAVLMEDAGGSLDSKVAAALAPDGADDRHRRGAVRRARSAGDRPRGGRRRRQPLHRQPRPRQPRDRDRRQLRRPVPDRRASPLRRARGPGHRAPRPRAGSVGRAADQQPAQAAGTERRGERERGSRRAGPRERCLSQRDGEGGAEPLWWITR